jgi:hypothetical protein
MTADEARVINSVSIETPTGYRVLQLVHGDITAVRTDLLICTSHPHEDKPLAGQIIHRLHERHGLDLHCARRWLSLDNGCSTCFTPVPPGLPFSYVLILRMPDPEAGVEGSILFDRAIQGTFAAVAALEMLDRGFPVLSLPVVYGQQIANHVAGADSLIRRATEWLKQSRHTQTVQMVFNDDHDMDEWDRAMNRSLGRSYVSGGTSHVLDSLCREILQMISAHDDARLAGVTRLLRQSLARVESLCVEPVCAFGRKLVEVMLGHLLPLAGLKVSGVLINNIEELHRCPRVPPWICSYMHTLRILGNESVHMKEKGPGTTVSRLTVGDLISALSAVRSLLAFWHSFLNERAEP